MTEITEAIIRSRSGEFDVANVTRLDLSGLGIYEISALEQCPALVELNLANNRIAKIGGLAHLKHLKKLVLSNNRVSRIENLEHMFSLEHLHLDGNQIGNLSNLATLNSLPRLQSLYLSTLSGPAGNPVCEHKKYRETVAEYLPDLRILDGQRQGAEKSIYRTDPRALAGGGDGADDDGVTLPPQQTWFDDPELCEGLLSAQDLETALEPALDAYRNELLQCRRACAAASSVVDHYRSTTEKPRPPSRPPSSPRTASAGSRTKSAGSRRTISRQSSRSSTKGQ